MGYKYGVWYTYQKDLFPIIHQGHFTVTCYMEKEEAINLYRDIKKKYGILTEITIDRNKPIIFEANMYDDDDNNLQSCGYNGENKNWKNLEEISKKYKCNFSHQPHTSLFYSKSEEEIINQVQQIKNKKEKETQINCELNVVDICSDNPIEWNIIKMKK